MTTRTHRPCYGKRSRHELWADGGFEHQSG